MRFGILGAGALGCLFAARLHHASHEVTIFHHRRDILNEIRKHGIRLRDTSRRLERETVDAKISIDKSDHFDSVLLTVKAHDTINVAKQLAKTLRKNTTLLTLQNGLGNVETLTDFLPRSSILAGSTTEASRLVKAGFVEHTGSGITWIGELNGKKSGRLVALRKALQGAGFDTRLSKNINGVLWSKAILNSAINPLTAITRLRNGELLQIPELLQLADMVIQEGIEVSRASSVKLPTPGPKKLVRQVLASSKRNKSSMLQDVERGKKTEIFQLNGIISEIGQSRGIPTPYNSELTAIVTALERSHS